MRGFAVFQEQPVDPPAPPAPAPGPINITNVIDFRGIAEQIWQWFIDHVGELGEAVREPLLETIERGMREAAWAMWNAAWGSSANIITQLPADLTTGFGPYRAAAGNPVGLAIAGATLAIVLLGLRTILGSMVGRDHVVTHVTGRLIPATAMAVGFPLLLVQGFGILNQAASGLGSVPMGEALMFSTPTDPALLVPYAVLWCYLIYCAIRLMIRLAYSLFRLLVAMLFGPVALILWAIPQTEWVTSLWLRELLGWSTTPLLVTACLAMALPMASGQAGFLGAAVFGIAGLQAAYDLIGLLTFGRAHGGSLAPNVGRLAAMAGGGGAVAAASYTMPASSWRYDYSYGA